MSSEEISYEILPEEYSYYDYIYKLIVIGDAFVGKSSLTSKATKDKYIDEYSATIGFEFITTTIKMNNKIFKLQIWDTCGQEIYRSLITSFYRNASLGIIVYSIDNIESFENLELWLKELRKFGNPDIKIFVIGNKSDLHEKRMVSYNTGKAFVTDNNLNFFMETSAKTGFNVMNLFVEGAKVLYNDRNKYVHNKRLSSHISKGLRSIRSNTKDNNLENTNNESNNDSKIIIESRSYKHEKKSCNC